MLLGNSARPPNKYECIVPAAKMISFEGFQRVDLRISRVEDAGVHQIRLKISLEPETVTCAELSAVIPDQP